MRAPSNSVAASLFFIASIVLDALTAIDSTENADAPASLRGVSLTLVACLAAPLVKNKNVGVQGVLQRPLVSIALASVSLLGLHYGGVYTRTFDALYITFVGFLIVYLFSSGGLDEMSKMSAQEKMNRAVATSASTLAGSLLFYSGLRTLRAGIQHPAEVEKYRVKVSSTSSSAWESATELGYAYASDLAGVSLVAGGTAGAAAGFLVLFNHEELSFGTEALSAPLCAVGVFQLVASLGASISYGHQIKNLPALFGSTACKATTPACNAAREARRFAYANTPVSALWVSALGLLALGFPPSARLYEKTGVFKWNIFGNASGLVTLAASLILVFVNGDFSGRGGHTDYVLWTVIFAVYTSFFIDNVLWAFIYIVAMCIEEAFYVSLYGVETLFSHLTHLTLVVTIILLALHILLQTANSLFRSAWLYSTTGVVAAIGTSLSLALYLASASLVAVSNGDLGNLQDAGDGMWMAFSFVLQHFFPLLIWLSLVVCRCEFHILNVWQRTIAWIASLLLLLIVYAFSLLALDQLPPTFSVVDGVALSGAILGAGFVPWLAASGM